MRNSFDENFFWYKYLDCNLLHELRFLIEANKFHTFFTFSRFDLYVILLYRHSKLFIFFLFDFLLLIIFSGGCRVYWLNDRIFGFIWVFRSIEFNVDLVLEQRDECWEYSWNSARHSGIHQFAKNFCVSRQFSLTVAGNLNFFFFLPLSAPRTLDFFFFFFKSLLEIRNIPRDCLIRGSEDLRWIAVN